MAMLAPWRRDGGKQSFAAISMPCWKQDERHENHETRVRFGTNPHMGNDRRRVANHLAWLAASCRDAEFRRYGRTRAAVYRNTIKEEIDRQTVEI